MYSTQAPEMKFEPLMASLYTRGAITYSLATKSANIIKGTDEWT